MFYINVLRFPVSGVKYEVLKTIIFYRVPLFKRKLLFIASYCLYEQGLSILNKSILLLYYTFEVHHGLLTCTFALVLQNFIHTLL